MADKTDCAYNFISHPCYSGSNIKLSLFPASVSIVIVNDVVRMKTEVSEAARKKEGKKESRSQGRGVLQLVEISTKLVCGDI